MRVLVACEFSGTVRDAFRALGHDAVSCDLIPTERPGPHHRGDVRELLSDGWDVMIAHPPCTYLATSGARWMDARREVAAGGFWPIEDPQETALRFVQDLLDAPIPRIALENPKSVIYTRIRPPDQEIQPWQHGHGEVKTTALWLKGLPLLEPTYVVPGRTAKIHAMPPGRDRWRDRSRTYPGIAAAMAVQWGGEA
jgi:hypothetical protein